MEEASAPAETTVAAEGDVVESPLVGVAYLAAGPDKPALSQLVIVLKRPDIGDH